MTRPRKNRANEAVYKGTDLHRRLQYVDTKSACSSTEPVTPGVWHGRRYCTSLWVTGFTRLLLLLFVDCLTSQQHASVCHVQPAVCHLVRRDSSAVKFDRVEIAFILALLYWLKPLTVEGGEETGEREENP